MHFEAYKSLLYSDTLVPDIFISEYLPSLDGETVKVYLQCLLLSKYNKQAADDELSKTLELDPDRVKNALTRLESLGIITKTGNSILINDLKEKEINRLYRMRATSSPEDALENSERNIKRNRAIASINNKFFQGVMSPSWYTDIDHLFNKCRFDEDVMMALFQHCFQCKGLTRQYVAKVAESWCSKNIVNHFDLENFYTEYQKIKDIKIKVMKKLNRKSLLTEYEEDYIEKWVMEYKFPFDIIEIALKKTTSSSSPNFEYIHRILTTWHEKGLRTKEDIMECLSKKTKPAQDSKTLSNLNNFKQRSYDDEFFDNLYENTKDKK